MHFRISGSAHRSQCCGHARTNEGRISAGWDRHPLLFESYPGVSHGQARQAGPGARRMPAAGSAGACSSQTALLLQRPALASTSQREERFRFSLSPPPSTACLPASIDITLKTAHCPPCPGCQCACPSDSGRLLNTAGGRAAVCVLGLCPSAGLQQPRAAARSGLPVCG